MNIEPLKQIKEICTHAAQILLKVTASGVKGNYIFDIDCNNLVDYHSSDVRASPSFLGMFTALEKITGPTLYWFEIISEHNGTAIIDDFKKYTQLENAKTTPAIKKTIFFDTRILYVGKVKRNFSGRIIQHLGYYPVSRTQGLQLCYWSQQSAIKLKLHAWEFDESMADLIPFLENGFARILKPLLGKHK